MPAYNEADRIARTVEAVAGLPGVTAVWVVDDGSEDDTSKRARQAGASVWRLSRNGGKGAALTAGLRRVTTPFALTVDGDTGASAAEALPLIDAVMRGADMAVGCIGAEGNSRGWGLVRGLAAFALRCRFGCTVTSPLSGQRAFRREALARVLPLAPGWGCEIGMTWDALRAGLKVVEVPVAMAHRRTGRDWQGVRHRSSQMRDVLGALAGRRVALEEEGGPWTP